MRKQAKVDLLTLIDSTEDLIWSVDLDYRLVTFNRALQQDFEVNFGTHAAVGKCSEDLLPAELAKNWPPLYRRALEDGPFRTEYTLKSGRLLELSLNPIVVDGKATGVWVFGKDITERKQAVDALRASEARLKKAEHLAMFGNSIWDADTDTTTWSDGLYRITGRNPSTPAPNRAERAKLYTAESFARFDPVITHTLATGEPYDLELQIVRADGALRWTRARGEAVRNESGRVCKLIGTLQDITDQKLLEEKLRSSEESYRATVEQAAVGIVQTSLEGVFLRCNPRFAEILGYPQEEIPGMTFQQITAPEDLAVSLKVSRQMADGLITSAALEKRYIRKDGSFTWVRITLLLQRDLAGKASHHITVVEDINRRKAAEEAHAKAEQKFREIFEEATEGIFQTTREGKSLALNPAGARILGFPSPGDAVASITDSAHDVWLHPEERARYTRLLEEQGEVHDFSCQFKRTDGTPIWVSLTTRRICGQDGQTLYYQGFIEDITEQTRLDAALRDKIRELEMLSEINNALLCAKTEEDLLREHCRIIVEVGGYRMAWVGFAENDPDKRIVPVAHHGHDDGYLKILNLTWADTVSGRGPTARAIRSGKVEIVEDVNADSAISPWREEALMRGYKSSIALPFSHSDGSMACLTAYGAMQGSRGESERALMEQIAQDLGFGIRSLRTEIAKEQFQKDLHSSLEQTIQVVAETIDQRDPYTAGHQRRVADLCSHLARKLGLSEDRTHGLHLAANVHDLGKIGVPAELLARPGKLSPAQFSLIKEHADLGYEILKNVKFPWPIADMVRQHHERIDGSGYPLGLKAQEILLESRIMAVADVVEAMSSHRPYRVARGIDVALSELVSQRGTGFDSAVVDACVQLFRDEGYVFPA